MPTSEPDPIEALPDEVEAIVPVPGSSLWTVSAGDGAAVMLCSGGPGCCDYLAPLAALLAPRFRTLRFEQRGCGRSGPQGPFDLETCIADLEHVRRHYGLERWVMCGHSWGADLALAYTLAHPDRVEGLIHLCAHGFHDDRGWSETYHRNEEERGEVAPAFTFEPNLEVNRAGNASLRRYVKRPSLWHDVASLRVPTLVVTAAEDLRPSWPNEQLAALLPDARHVVIEGASHFAWIDRAEALRAALDDFADTRLRGGRSGPESGD